MGISGIALADLGLVETSNTRFFIGEDWTQLVSGLVFDLMQVFKTIEDTFD